MAAGPATPADPLRLPAGSSGRAGLEMSKLFLISGSVSAALAVILGAFAAHALKSRLAADSLAAFQTGVHYHLIHSVGLVLVGLLARDVGRGALIGYAGGVMLAGIVLFSGSLYALSTTGVRSLGMITPFGGLLLILSWVLLAVSVARS